MERIRSDIGVQAYKGISGARCLQVLARMLTLLMLLQVYGCKSDVDNRLDYAIWFEKEYATGSNSLRVVERSNVLRVLRMSTKDSLKRPQIAYSFIRERKDGITVSVVWIADRPEIDGFQIAAAGGRVTHKLALSTDDIAANKQMAERTVVYLNAWNIQPGEPNWPGMTNVLAIGRPQGGLMRRNVQISDSLPVSVFGLGVNP